MHPIERLRFVARANHAPQDVLVGEAAAALAAFSDDPQGLVNACRRVVARQPGAGALVWLCSRVLTAADPAAEARRLAVEVADDPTPGLLAAAVPDEATTVIVGWPDVVTAGLGRRGDLRVLVGAEEGVAHGAVGALSRAALEAEVLPLSAVGAAAAAADLVLLEAEVAGAGRALVASGSRAAAAVAAHAGVPVWLVVGVGRALPAGLFDEAVAASLPEEPWDGVIEILPLDLVDRVVDPEGLRPPDEALAHVSGPVTPELFRGIAL